MRTPFTRFLLAFAAVLLFAATVSADAMAAPAAAGGDDLLAALACNPTQSKAPQLDPVGVEQAEPQFMTGCTAELTCYGGAMISCSGNTSCFVDCGSVVCDGNQTECTCNEACASTAYCACRTCGGTKIQCLLQWC